MNTAHSPRLSVAILARNGAAQVRETIASVRDLADEIVVLDTGSTDDTLVVALQAGAQVHRRAWDDSFAAARNACLEKVTGDWVLWLDAGETFGAQESQSLRLFLQQQARPRRAYLLAITMPAAAGQIGCEQVARLRLHPRLAGLAFAGRVRERLDESLAHLGLHAEMLPIDVLRSARDHEPAVKAGRAQRNIRLADLQIAEQGPSADLHNCLGESFQVLGDAMRAGQHYRRALDLAAANSRERLEAYYGLLTCLDGLASDRGTQLALCMQALEQFPLDAQLLVALGGYLQAQGHAELAVRSYDVALRHGQIELQIWHLPEIREIAAVCAATALQAVGNDDDARTLLEAAVRMCPQSVRLGRQLIELHVKHGRRDEALAAVATLPIPGRDALAAAVRGACLAGQLNWPAAKAKLQAALEAGCRERFCFRWLVVTWLGLGQPAEAQSVLRAWQAIDPANPELAALAAAVDEQVEASDADPATGNAFRVDAAEGPASPVIHVKTGTHTTLNSPAHR